MLRYDHVKRKMAGMLGKATDEDRERNRQRLADGVAGTTRHPSDGTLRELQSMFAAQDVDKEIADAEAARKRHMGG